MRTSCDNFSIVTSLVIICLWSKKLPICKVCYERFATFASLRLALSLSHLLVLVPFFSKYRNETQIEIIFHTWTRKEKKIFFLSYIVDWLKEERRNNRASERWKKLNMRWRWIKCLVSYEFMMPEEMKVNKNLLQSKGRRRKLKVRTHSTECFMIGIW